MNIIIRTLKTEDNPFIEQVIRSCLIEYGANHEGTAWADPCLSKLSEVYNSDGNKYWVAIDDKKNIVVAGCGIGKLEGALDTCELQKLYCLKEYRRLGIGKKLIETALDYAKEYYKRCYLETLDNMNEAINLYEKYGFKRISEPIIDTGHFNCDVRYIKNLIKTIFTIFCFAILVNPSFVYAYNPNAIGLDSGLVHSYLAEDESGNREIQDVVNSFMNTYINDNMSELEKEIAIIKYLVETVEYDVEELQKSNRKLSDTYKAYGALVYKKAVCSGYAKAFDLLAKKCGLMTTIVTGDAMNDYIVGPHAWNQIYLDGDWYNVDVTFEDPQTNIKLGFNDLMNRYINVTDFEISHNHTRENGHTCTATKYGKNVVGYYLHTGEVNLNGNLDAVRLMYFNMFKQYLEIGDETSAQAIVDKIIVVNPRLSDNSNFILYPSDEIINNYILNKFNAGERFICIVTNKGTKDLFSIDKNDWTKNNITLAGRITLYKYFISDGEYEARLLYFKTS